MMWSHDNAVITRYTDLNDLNVQLSSSIPPAVLKYLCVCTKRGSSAGYHDCMPIQPYGRKPFGTTKYLGARYYSPSNLSQCSRFQKA